MRKASAVGRSLINRVSEKQVDRIYPYLGLAFCFYELECFEESAGSFNLALEIIADLENFETDHESFILNNVGCCLLRAGKNMNAIDYFKAAERTLELKYGCQNTHLTLVQANLEKNFQKTMEFSVGSPVAFRFFVPSLSKINLKENTIQKR